MKENVITTLTEHRVHLDEVVKRVKALPGSRAMNLAITAIEKGRMYYGEVCHDLGHDYPYHKTKTAKVAEEIQPAADIADIKVQTPGNEIEELNKIRETLDLINKNFLDTVLEYRQDVKISNNRERFINDANIAEAYRGIKEGRMYLGVRLGEIKDGVQSSQVVTKNGRG